MGGCPAVLASHSFALMPSKTHTDQLSIRVYAKSQAGGRPVQCSAVQRGGRSVGRTKIDPKGTTAHFRCHFIIPPARPPTRQPVAGAQSRS